MILNNITNNSVKRSRKLGILMFILVAVVASYWMYLHETSPSKRKAREQAIVQDLLRQNARISVSERSFAGMRWETVSDDGWREIYHFNADGSLPHTVITPDGKTSAGLLSWKVAQDEIYISDFSGHRKKRYRVVGISEGRIYLFNSDQSIESYSIRENR